MATAVTPKVFKNYIDGEWIPARSGKAIEDRNPANTGELVGMFPASSADDVNQAIDAAKQAFKTWRLTPAPKRAEILYRAAEILTQRKEDFAKLHLCQCNSLPISGTFKANTLRSWSLWT